jgi:MOSC domain-containing protein YiiM
VVAGKHRRSWANSALKTAAEVQNEAGATCGYPRQVTVMNARVAGLVAGGTDRMPLAGDQLYVDLDLSVENLPPGSLYAVGQAVLQVSEAPHLGCAKFVERFGAEAMRFVNSRVGRQLRLRGMNARVLVPGTVRVGDLAVKVPAGLAGNSLREWAAGASG